VRGFYLIRLTGQEKIIITKLNNLFMFLPLIQCPTPPKQWNYASPTPPARCTFPPYYPPLRPPVFGWLLCLQSSTGGHLRPQCILYFIFFHHSICHPKQWDSVPPRAPRPACLRSITPPTGSANYWVDCCLKSPKGGHLSSEPGASLNFLCALFRRSN
jgi:hypothetical protein